jgi:signal peptidase I
VVACFVVMLAVVLVPRLTGLQLDHLAGHSMEPTIADGSLIAIGKVDPARIKVGDIIGFLAPGFDTRVCHRVIGIARTVDGYGFFTKGDGNGEPDIWVVAPQDVLGKVYFNTSWFIPAVKFAGTTSGFVLLMLLPALTILGILVKEILFEVKGRKHARPQRVPSQLG